MKLFLSLAIAGLVIVSTSGRADDTPETKLKEAQGLYDQRADAAKVDQALAVLKQAAALPQKDQDTQYDILILTSKTTYFKGLHTDSKTDKLTLFDSAKATAVQAEELKPDYADAYYWHAANLARWGEAKGKTSPAVLPKIAELKKALDTLEAGKLKSRDGKPSDAYEGYGADRIYGRIYHELPSLLIPFYLGGSRSKSVTYLDKAYSNAKDYALNAVYDAESLADISSDKTTACQILADLLKNDPKKLNPARIPETEDEFAEAKALQAKLCQ